MDKVVHFEIPVDDLARAKKFYSSIFGWNLQDMAMPGGTNYTVAMTVPVNEEHLPKEPGAINGGITQRTSDVRSSVIVINVSSVDQYLKKVTASGGRTVKPKTQVGDMGAFAYVADSEGNVIGLWEDLKKA